MSADSPSTSASAVATLVPLDKRLRRPRLVIILVSSVLVGALLGGLVFGLRAPDRAATAFIRITQPTDLAAVASGAGYSTPDAQPVTESYVAGEVAYLSGEGFAQEVSARVGDTEVTATQAGGSSVIMFSATATSGDAAAVAVQTAIDLYRQTLKERADQQLRNVLPTLDRWQAATVDPLRTAEIARLREAIEIQGEHAAAVTVLQAPTVDDDVLAEWMTGAALGAVGLGGAVGWLLIARRRRQPPLVSQVADTVHGVLIPAVDLQQPPRASWGAPQQALARTLIAQIGAPEASRVIITVGATATSGTDVIATLLELAAADHGPPGALGPAIVDAGSGGFGPLAEHSVGRATHIVVVVRMDTDKAEKVLPVLSAAAGYGVPVLAAFTFRPTRHMLSARRGTAPGSGRHYRPS